MWFWFAFSLWLEKVSISSCVFWPFGFLLLKKFCFQLLISLLVYWFWRGLLFWAPPIFWLSVLCLMYSWKIFSPTLWVVCSVQRPFLLLCRSFIISFSIICPSFLLVAELLVFYWGSPCLYLLLPEYSLPFSVLASEFWVWSQNRSLIYFELILVQGDKHGSSFSFLQANNHFSQQHLLKRLSIFHCMFLAPLSK
jgi:hypothetical protein